MVTGCRFIRHGRRDTVGDPRESPALFIRHGKTHAAVFRRRFRFRRIFGPAGGHDQRPVDAQGQARQPRRLTDDHAIVQRAQFLTVVRQDAWRRLAAGDLRAGTVAERRHPKVMLDRDRASVAARVFERQQAHPRGWFGKAYQDEARVSQARSRNQRQGARGAFHLAAIADHQRHGEKQGEEHGPPSGAIKRIISGGRIVPWRHMKLVRASVDARIPTATSKAMPSAGQQFTVDFFAYGRLCGRTRRSARCKSDVEGRQLAEADLPAYGPRQPFRRPGHDIRVGRAVQCLEFRPRTRAAAP